MLSVQHITKSFEGKPILQDLTLYVPDRSTVSILGRSGSGKTTLLKILAGLTPPDSGSILLDHNDISTVPSGKRNIVYIYQESLLFPHLDVFENVAFGLRVRKLPADEINKRTRAMLRDLGLEDKLENKPHELSGGQQQRVSFGRALIVNPKILLLDEPFGNLDTATRGEMQSLFKRITKQYEITSVFVTHDLKEAILMGDQIGLLKNGGVRLYETKKEFIQDSDSGVKQERDFWQSITDED